MKIATGLWWTVPFAFISKIAIKASHPNLAAAIGEYIEGCLWAVAALVILHLSIRLGLALWETVFGPVESRDKVHAMEQYAPTPKAGPCIESIEELAHAADEETRKETTEEVPEGPSKVKITFVPDDQEAEVEPEFV